MLRLASFVTTAECAAAEKPSPPYSGGRIIPKKPCSRRNAHTGSGRSPCCSISHSSSIPHRRSTGPSRNRRSASESGFGRNASSADQSGRPEKSWPSKPTVPASSAMRSVSPMRGSSGAMRGSRDAVTRRRRSAGTPSASAAAPSTTAPPITSARGAPPPARTARKPAAPSVQAARPRPRWSSASAMPAPTTRARRTFMGAPVAGAVGRTARPGPGRRARRQRRADSARMSAGRRPGGDPLRA